MLFELLFFINQNLVYFIICYYLRRKLFKSIHNAFGGNLIKIVTGGAPIRAELGSFFDSIGINLINGYGITECSPLVSANRDYFNDCATVGVPLSCVEIKFENVTPEGDGEICVKGDTVMLGYYKNNVCLQLPVYKKISQIVIRDKEFDKTTTNKLKR